MIKRRKSLSFRGKIRTLTVASLPQNDRIHLLTEKPRRACRLPAAKIKIIFSRDMCVRENTSQSASVEFCRYAAKLCAQQTASLLAENSSGIFASLKKDGPSRNRPFNLHYSKNYLPMFIWAATSAAKSSCFFSMPSPVAKRTAFTNFTEPPSFLAASAM